MMHQQIIKCLSPIFMELDGIDAGILYGSFARNDATPQSDIDIAIIVNQAFKESDLEAAMQDSVPPPDYVFQVEMRNKIVCYFNDFLIKLEISIHDTLESFGRNFTGSCIPNELMSRAVIFDRHGSVLNSLPALIGRGYRELSKDEIVHKFIYEFDNCSTYHRRSDGYRSLFFYHIALHCLVQLINMVVDDNRYQFLPRNLLVNITDDNSRELLYGLNGSMFLPKINDKKRRLLDKFYDVLDSLKYKNLNETKVLLEKIYQRDRYWNLRTLNTFNPEVQWGNLVRSSNLSVMSHDAINSVLASYQIHTIVDLRASRELNEQTYSDNLIKTMNYVHAPLDPWSQPEWFKTPEFQKGTNEEIAYRFFILGCRDSLRQALQALIAVPEGKGAIVHCEAGKDRTGIFFTLLHLLTNAELPVVLMDYLASEVDVSESKIQLVLEVIEKEGGIKQYLLNCGLTTNELSLLRKKLVNA